MMGYFFVFCELGSFACLAYTDVEFFHILFIRTGRCATASALKHNYVSPVVFGSGL
jgi:hypothetical protein